jgi:isoaspartyl peptidase/L-asparaginase-like protein (Ntn-hydrolase superfamily)
MEAMVAAPVEVGQLVMSSTEVVSHVLSSSSKFLHNVGLQPASKTSSVSAKVHELQSQLETKRQEKYGLRQEMETLKATSQESTITIANQSIEIEYLKKSLAENNSLLRQILSINRGQMSPP